MRISAITNIEMFSKVQNSNNTNVIKDHNSQINEFKNNINYNPLFLGKINLVKISSQKTLIKPIQKMFPSNSLPKSPLTKIVWERANSGNTKTPEYDLKLNLESYKIFADLVKEYQGFVDFNADSKIFGMKNKDLLMSFVKMTQEKGTSNFYIDLSKTNKPLFNHMIKSILSITPETLNAILDYKHSSWRMGAFISSCNIPYIKGELENNNPWAMDYVNYADNNDAKSVFNDVNTLTNAIENSKIDNKLILYRGDQFDGILNLIYDNNGNICRLGSKIEDFIKNNPNATEEEISNFATNILKGKKFTKDRFMSMSASKDLACKWATSNKINSKDCNQYGAVVFEETIPVGNGLIFMEPYNAMKDNNEDQFEFLGQRGDNHIVTAARFDKDQKILFVKTELEHNIPQILYPVNFPTINKTTATPQDVINAIEAKEYNYAWQ